MLKSYLPFHHSGFLTWTKLTLVLVYLVILAGAVVRATGSGMGCPDWPKCFGRWVPPTEVSQLPENYQEIYADHSYANSKFNALKTWIEYLNRLLGALLGFVVLLLAAASLSYWSKSRKLVFLCVFLLVLMAFQAWLGKLVVDTNLAPVRITLHMLAALVIVWVVLVIRSISSKLNHQAQPLATPGNTNNQRAFMVAMVLFTLIQVVFGTRVRQKVDEFLPESKSMITSDWFQNLEPHLTIHKNTALAITLLNVLLLLRLKKRKQPAAAQQQLIVACLLTEFLSGLALNYASLPGFVQPIHLLLVSIVFGLQSQMLIASLSGAPPPSGK